MAEDPTCQVGRRVLFSGRVQGVGFRFTTCHLAGRFQVTGYVKNLADGRVELVCEGTPTETAQFVDAVRRAMGDYIGQVLSSKIPASGQYPDFGMRY